MSVPFFLLLFKKMCYRQHKTSVLQLKQNHQTWLVHKKEPNL